jgi:hypothetical protein
MPGVYTWVEALGWEHQVTRLSRTQLGQLSLTGTPVPVGVDAEAPLITALPAS